MQKNIRIQNKMCLYVKYMRNKKYFEKKTIKTRIDYKTGLYIDEYSPLQWVPIKCGTCSECRREKANMWKFRLLQEYKARKCGQFVTLTISDDWGKYFEDKLKTEDSEKIATKMVYYFRERWRKKFGKSPVHFLITELGHRKQWKIGQEIKFTTQRLHLHGLIFEDITKFGKITQKNKYDKKAGRISETLSQLWNYGNAEIGYSDINEKTINYITKYITKPDTEHIGFMGTILCTPGIGKIWYEEHKNDKEYKPKLYGTNTRVQIDGTHTIPMPQYYKLKFWDSDTREMIRLEHIDEETQIIKNNVINKNDSITIAKILKYYQKEEVKYKLRANKRVKYSWHNGKALN